MWSRDLGRRVGPLVVLVCALGLAAPTAGGRQPAPSTTRDKTTLSRTIVPRGEEKLGFGKGQPRVTRTLNWPHTKGSGRPLGAFKHLSDIHLVDEESPGRVEWLDTCGTPFVGAYRVQEAMTTQVGDSMLRQLAKIRRGPATGAPLRFTISTGDNIDNNQENELDWFVRLLDGRRVDPNSGGNPYEGYTRDEFSDALPLATLKLAQKAFDTTGTKGPWYAVVGNHDGLVQGNVPANPSFEVVATGGVKAFVPIEAAEDCPDDPADAARLEDIIQDALNDQARAVTADPKRSFLDHKELISGHFEGNGKPRGHGFAKAPKDPLHDARAGYYTFRVSKRIRGISLDTLSYDGGPDGHIPDPQFKWLRKKLMKFSEHYYEGKKKVANENGNDKLIMIFSHHSSATLGNPGANDEAMPYHCFRASDQPECGGLGLKGLVHKFPNVIAWVNGHEHNNAVRAFPSKDKHNPARGFWELNTAAHIDWPQQARLVEVAWKPGRSRADSIYIFGTIVDHAARPKPDKDEQGRVAYLASLSRLEAYVDACVRQQQAECGAGGGAPDKNVKLVLKAPFDLGR